MCMSIIINKRMRVWVAFLKFYFARAVTELVYSPWFSTAEAYLRCTWVLRIYNYVTAGLTFHPLPSKKGPGGAGGGRMWVAVPSILFVILSVNTSLHSFSIPRNTSFHCPFHVSLHFFFRSIYPLIPFFVPYIPSFHFSFHVTLHSIFRSM